MRFKIHQISMAKITNCRNIQFVPEILIENARLICFTLTKRILTNWKWSFSTRMEIVVTNVAQCSILLEQLNRLKSLERYWSTLLENFRVRLKFFRFRVIMARDVEIRPIVGIQYLELWMFFIWIKSNYSRAKRKYWTGFSIQLGYHYRKIRVYLYSIALKTQMNVWMLNCIVIKKTLRRNS